MRGRQVTAHTPVFLPFPIAVVLPSFPFMLDARGGDELIVPGVSVPVAIPVVAPPVRVYPAVEDGDAPVVAPVVIIVPGSVPSPVPQPPPPADVEVDVFRDLGHGIDVCPGDDDDRRMAVIADTRRGGRADTHGAAGKREHGQDDQYGQ